MHFFTPGRTEIIGNHTDHQLGRVIAAAVRDGISAEIETTGDPGEITLRSEGYGSVQIRVRDTAPRTAEHGTTGALVRGVACAMAERGYRVGGFCGEVRSTLPVGGGLSSSAAFAVLIGKILNTLYNQSKIPPEELARCAQQAENRHFGKPSGLMDQMACALEQAVYLDFLTGEICPLSCDFHKIGLALCLTDTGGSHAGLTEAYARIPADMQAVAAEFGAQRLGEIPPDVWFAAERPQDLPHDRARHFFEENERAARMRDAIASEDGAQCVALMNGSGRSSERLLRNITAPTGDTLLAQGLARSAELLRGRGAWRVHGGGFAGCVQALVPLEMLEEYRTGMEQVFGLQSCREIM